jgi:hypothetical protein
MLGIIPAAGAGSRMQPPAFYEEPGRLGWTSLP